MDGPGGTRVGRNYSTSLAFHALARFTPGCTTYNTALTDTRRSSDGDGIPCSQLICHTWKNVKLSFHADTADDDCRGRWDPPGRGGPPWMTVTPAANPCASSMVPVRHWQQTQQRFIGIFRRHLTYGCSGVCTVSAKSVPCQLMAPIL